MSKVTAAPVSDIEVSPEIKAIAAFAVTELLQRHPKKGALPNMLIYKKAGDKGYRIDRDEVAYTDEESIMESARVALDDLLQEDMNIEAYAVVSDHSFERDDEVVYELHLRIGAASEQQGIIIKQEYKHRRLRRGAEISQPPVIEAGPDSLLFSDTPQASPLPDPS